MLYNVCIRKGEGKFNTVRPRGTRPRGTQTSLRHDFKKGSKILAGHDFGTWTSRDTILKSAQKFWWFYKIFLKNFCNFPAKLIFGKKSDFFPKEFQKIVIVYLSQTLIDFQNLSLFRKLMKILINLNWGRTATQPVSLVSLPLKILFNVIAFYLLLVLFSQPYLLFHFLTWRFYFKTNAFIMNLS